MNSGHIMKNLVAHTLQQGTLRRESLWTNNLAVGTTDA
jgi:hypothetical protein